MMRCAGFALTLLLALTLGASVLLMPACNSNPSAPPKTLTSISLTPSTPSIMQGQTQQFKAMGTYSDSTTQDVTGSASWSSSSSSVATISNTAGSIGLATSVASGSTTIQATMNGITGSTTLKVQPILTQITVTPPNPTVAQGQAQQFKATGTYSDNTMQDITTSVTWSAQTPSIAAISNSPGSNGLATAVGTGSCSVQAALGSVTGSTTFNVGVALSRLIVSPQYPSIADNGATQVFSATGQYNDGSTRDLTSSVTWTSSNTNVATVSAGGVATSVSLPSGRTAGFSSIQASVGSFSGVSSLSVTNHAGNGFAAVIMQHNDISRTGQNVNETTLTPANVRSATFGKLFSQPVDGYVYAQPLYVPGVAISGAIHNVIYVATEGDSVYAFDADNATGANASPLWHANLIDTNHGAASGATTVNVQASLDSNCTDLIPQVGITSTPAIDPSTNTMYVETKSQEGSNFVHRLHAIDITTGNEKAPGPVMITGSVLGTGDGSSNGILSFDGLRELNRPGLLLFNGIVYLAYASHCDISPYHGWLFAYDTKTFTQQAVFVTTPNGGLGGIWEGGAGLSADSAGNLYIPTGNGDFVSGVPEVEAGDTLLKLALGSNSFLLEDYFTPFNQGNLANNDNDLGSGGVVLLPDQTGANAHELIADGKEGTIYVVNRDQLTTGNLHYCSPLPPLSCNSDSGVVVQEVRDTLSRLWGPETYWNDNIYLWGQGDFLRSYKLNSGTLSTTATSTSSFSVLFPGPVTSISASGTSNGILWAIDATRYGVPAGAPGPAVLHAFDATNVANEFYNSNQAAGNRDRAGVGVKFSVPTVANGKVYVGTQTELDVYGLLP